MQTNMGRADRIFRIILGGVILGLYGALPAPWKYLTLLGLVPLGSGITGFCPLYAAIGWNRQRPQTGSGR
jgi:hypothetical protein